MVEIKGIGFEVEITHKKIRNLYLRLDGNKLKVSAPLRMPDYQVYQFINRRRDWIYKAYKHQEYRKSVSNKYNGGDIFYILDKPYHLQRIAGKKNVRIKDDVIYLSYPDESEDSLRYLYKQLDKQLLVEAEKYLQTYLPFLRDYGYTLNPELKCRIMTSRWGVCYPRKNKITISSYLIHYPLECLEYIIVHELTHFIVPNHSKRFYELVSLNMPDYKRASERLKR